MPRLIFVNLPVSDLARSTAFYQALGATKDERFCDGATAACLVFSETIHVMLLTHDKFRQFTPKNIANARETSEVLICISADSRQAVDATVEKAGAAVGAIISAGIIPAGLEMMDQPATRAVEEFVHAGYPLDAAAVLLVETDGALAAADMQIELARLLESERLARAEDVMTAAASERLRQALGVEAPSLEGYLFPDTYFFSPLDGTEKVLAAFVGRFHKVFTPEMAAEARKAGFSVHQIVTLASVTEKETAREEERPLVSAVFRYRLRLGMPLQADPTVIYGIENFNGNLTRKDLETRTPYNTYTEPGLPPGPIANPGRSSLLAAIHPADVPYLYFVAREDGSHEFSTSLADHNRAVNRYQRSRHARLETR